MAVQPSHHLFFFTLPLLVVVVVRLWVWVQVSAAYTQLRRTDLQVTCKIVVIPRVAIPTNRFEAHLEQLVNKAWVQVFVT